MTKTKDSNEGEMIPAESTLRSGPRGGERQGDNGGVTLSWAATNVDDNTTAVETNELVETVTAEVGADAGCYAPSISPDVIESA